MHYLKVFTDFRETIGELDDAEAGRLFRAMLRYAADGGLTELTGNERYLWPAAKQNLDREAGTYERVCERNRANRTGASPKKRRKRAHAKAEQECAKSAQNAPANADAAGVFDVASRVVQDKDKDKDKDKEKEKEDIRETLSIESTEKALPFPDEKEVAAYCREQGLTVDPAAFCRYYGASDWRDGSGRPVRSWKQKLLSWNSFSSGRAARAGPAKSAPRPGMGSLAGYRQTPLSEADFEAMFVDLDQPLPEA